MSLYVFILVAVSATLHVFWNLLVKQSAEKVSFAWLTSLAGTLVLAPIFVTYRLVDPGPLSLEILGWAALSGLFEALYVVFLFAAYGKADLSVVYPLSRGVAPVFTLLLGSALVGDRVDGRHLLWLALVVCGVVFVAVSIKSQAEGRWQSGDLLWPLATGAMIAAYHLVDRRAMSLAVAPNPVEYLFLMHFFLAMYVTAWALWRNPRQGLWAEWRLNRKSVVIVGICTPMAYLLIMLALRLGNVTYVAAGRNVGIVVSTLVGGLYLKEKVGPLRILGGLVIMIGVAALVAD
jgi:drug/metabolite transporter (DMT)-like permease